MKKLIYIICILIFISCKNEVNKVSEIPAFEEEDAEVYRSDDNFVMNRYQILSTQKLQEYFDLIKLKEKHPEFKDDILIQLRKLSNDSIPNYAGDFSIENIRQVGEVETISDSVQKIKLVYNVVSDAYKSNDSILATISSKTIFIDDTATISNKVVFSGL
ncbi:hypothetical protein Q4Q39_04370 [Flavivirga amylovorans]|uniref:Uncharacterized protein n=1 Tax=Flavivirga amylovorans TaxID=870486 RepID=A0ABT8WZ55_9FLAO|nr:hypothetical protein [Flavivirga amylovorans]MDO5986635.1 hypothetical protein [Flavivirga amylovorans]